MSKPSENSRFGTAAGRWSGVGPYYAMFPVEFANEVVKNHTNKGDVVLDPFAGRGTSTFSAVSQGRSAIGIDVNPLGYVYANAKLKPGDRGAVVQRLQELSESAHIYRDGATKLAPFFHYCYTPRVQEFLLAAKSELNWRHSKVDRTLMAFILISMQGKRQQALSNQMRHSTSMGPKYSIKWWTEKELCPPDVEPVEFILRRIAWRYVHGKPEVSSGWVYLADSRKKLTQLVREIREGKRDKAKLLFTSPPYHNVVNYYEDQWLRLWLLGAPEKPSGYSNRYGGKYASITRYSNLLTEVFCKAKQTLREDATVYIRTGSRPSTLDSTVNALEEIFPDKRIDREYHPMKERHKPYSRGGAPKKVNCEVDLILTPR